MKKKIAILHIATGRYSVFWKDFYASFQRYFLPECEKIFFLFTDNENLPVYDNVVRVHQENLGWPYITLLRFDIFLKVEQQLQKCDYIYFFNANMLAIDFMGQEVLPTEDQGLAVALHPHFYFLPRKDWTYDNNPQSKAYVSADQGDYYVQGAFIGGTRDGFLRMCHILSENIQDDLKHDIIALWHDESHLNHYILDKKPLILSPAYITAEGCFTPFDPKIIYLDKETPRYGGVQYMRGLTDIPSCSVKQYQGSLEEYFQNLFLKNKFAAKFISQIMIHYKLPHVVELSGDLGTQMFQYAFGQGLIKNGTFVVFYDSSGFIRQMQCFFLDGRGGGNIHNFGTCIPK